MKERLGALVKLSIKLLCDKLCDTAFRIQYILVHLLRVYRLKYAGNKYIYVYAHRTQYALIILLYQSALRRFMSAAWQPPLRRPGSPRGTCQTARTL